jgi:flagellar basal-body rod protein FlgG
MIDALYIAASGLRSEQKQIDVISNNVANMQTPGFKRSRVNFADVAGTALPAAIATDTPARAAEPMPGGTRISSTVAEFDAGELKPSGNPLDLAINGAGLFELELDNGTMAYTRDGQFRLDGEGTLRTMQGARLANAPQIPLEATEVRVSSAGEISVLMPGDTERTVLGSVELAVFGAADALQSVGDNRYTAHAGCRRAHLRGAGRSRQRQAAAGLCGNGQRADDRRDVQSGHGAAGLPAQRTCAAGRRPGA